MKKSNLLGLLFLSLLFTGCDKWFPTDSGYEHSLLVYMAADNSLSDLAVTNVNEIWEHASLPDDHALFIFTDRRGKGAHLLRINTRSHTVRIDTLFRYGIVNSVHPEMLEQVIKHTREECPAKTYGLILWSHGTGWLPWGLYGETPQVEAAPCASASAFQYNIKDPMYPQTKSFGKDGNAEMEISALATVLEKFTHEYVCFDACLMADVQTYYQLRNVSTYLMGSPTEIIDTGYPYHKLTSALFPYRGESSLMALCDAYYNKYDALSGYYQSATISLVKTAYIPGLAQAFKNVIQNGSVHPKDVNRQELQSYDRLKEHVFWDIEQMAEVLGTPADYTAFTRALQKAVVYKKATDYFITIPIRRYSGLAAYLPVSALPRTQEAFEVTSWNEYLGWLPLAY